MAQAGTATVKFVGDYSQMNAGLASALAPAKLKGSGMKAGLAVGGAFVAAFAGAKIVEEIGKAVSVTKQFDKQMSSLQAVAGASARQMDTLRKQAIKMGAATVFSATEAAQAQTELAKGGLGASQILGGALKSSLDLAAAGELELADAAETTVNAMQLFGLEGRATGRIADMLATAANKTTADVLDFAVALRQGGSVAKLAGYNLNDTVVVLEALAEAGIKNSDAGTSMKTSMLALLNPTAKQAKLAASLGVTWETQNGQLKDAVGISRALTKATRGMTDAERAKTFGILAGNDGIRTLNALYDAGARKLQGFSRANQEQGTAAETARIKTDNLSGDVEELSGAYETLQITIGTLVTPALRELVQVGTDATRWVNGALNGLDTEALGLGKSWRDLAGDTFEFGKALAQIPFDADGGIKRLVNVLSGEGGKEISRLQQTMTARLSAVRSLQRYSTVARNARHRVAGAARAEQQAEAALRNARKRHGDGSEEVLRAEIRLQRAKRRTIRLTREARLAERLQGVQRQVVASRTRDQVVTEKSRIGVLNRQIQTLGRQWKAERRNHGNSKRSRELEQQVIQKITQRDKSQRRLNNVLGDAARQIGPKFAKSLQNISVKSATMERALGRLPNPTGRVRSALGQLPPVMDRVGDTATKKFGATDRAMDKMRTSSGVLKRIYNRNMGAMPPKTSSAMGRIQGSLKSALDSIQNTGIPSMAGHRKGGLVKLVQGFRDGGVPVALSSGELYKTPDGKMGVVPGQPTRSDNVLTSMPAGTKIFTFDGQRRLAAGQSEDQVLRSQRPHFADGGIVKPKITGGTRKSAQVANAAVGKAHEGAKKRLQWIKSNMIGGGNIVALGKSLQRMGYEVGEHPAFGGVAPVHSKNSYHYQGRAIDVNDDVNPRGGSETASLDWLNAQLRRVPGVVELLWRVARHYDHLHVAMKQGGMVGDPPGHKWKHGKIQPQATRRRRRPSGGKVFPYQVAQYAAQAGFPRRELRTAVAVAGGESEFNPRARYVTSVEDSRGLWQINTYSSPWAKRKNLFNPSWNAKVAKVLWKQRGWQPWSAYTSGKYRDYWGQAGHAVKTALRVGLDGPSAADRREARNAKVLKARRAAMKKLWGKAKSAKNPLVKQGKWMDIIEAYLRWGDFDAGKSKKGKKFNEAKTVLNWVKDIKSTPDRLERNFNFKYLLKFLTDRVEIGSGKPNKKLMASYGRISKMSAKREKKRRKRVFNRYQWENFGEPMRGYLKELSKNTRKQAYLTELREVAEQEHQGGWSEAGSELSEKELAKELKMNRNLLRLMKRQRTVLEDAIPDAHSLGLVAQGELWSVKRNPFRRWEIPGIKRTMKKAFGTEKKLKGDLRELVGLSGTSGAMNEVRLKLKELGFTGSDDGSGATGGISFSDLSRIIDFARSGGYDNLPKFHSGGDVGGSSHSEIMAILKGREGVFTQPQMGAIHEGLTSPAGPGDIKVIVHGDIVSELADPVEVVVGSQRFRAEVQREVGESNRRRDQRVRAGMR